MFYNVLLPISRLFASKPEAPEPAPHLLDAKNVDQLLWETPEGISRQVGVPHSWMIYNGNPTNKWMIWGTPKYSYMKSSA